MNWETLAQAGADTAAQAGSNLRTVAIALLLAYLAGGVAAYFVGKAKGSRKLFKNFLLYSALTFFGVVMAAPFYWMLVTSVKSASEASAVVPTFWPEKFMWENFTQAWNLGQSKPDVSFTRYFYVSVVTSALSTAGALATGLLAAYAFAKLKFYGSGLFFYIMLMMMMVPGQVLLVPSYVILDKLGWFDTFMALIVPWTASMFAIFLLRQFIMGIPNDLWDAAQIDGASRLRFLWTVVVPLCVPALISTGIFLFLGNWNSLLWPLIVTNRPDMRTIQVGLQAFNSSAGTDYHLLMAASTIVIAPVVLFFFVAQRYFIEGIARSGIK